MTAPVGAYRGEMARIYMTVLPVSVCLCLRQTLQRTPRLGAEVIKRLMLYKQVANVHVAAIVSHRGASSTDS